MNILTVLGIILIALGAIGLIYGGISYTTRESVIDMGSMHVQVDQQNRVPFSPIAGAVALVAGIILVFVGRRRPARQNAE